jgi:CheY-like chemotaxis protein/Tfp pilus assembly protein PilZ
MSSDPKAGAIPGAGLARGAMPSVKRVLINDPDTQLVQQLADVLGQQGPRFDVLTSHDPADAREILKRTQVDLLITGIHGLKMDGFQLLADVNFHHRSTKVIVMLDPKVPLPQATVRYFGADAAYRLPVDMAEITERVYLSLQLRIRGEVWGLHLSSFLQLLNADRKTCSLTVEKEGQKGRLYLVKGDLIAAECGKQTPDEALYTIMSWDDPVIEIDYLPFSRARNVTAGLMTLLMEAQRRKDEESMAKLQQRRHTRFRCLVAVDFDLRNAVYRHLIRDLSEGGAYIESDAPVTVGDEIELKLRALRPPRHCALRGRVVRREPGGFGIQFLDANEDKRAFLRGLGGLSPPAGDAKRAD